jgi:NADH-quinone oxidoreductase subunit M
VAAFATVGVILSAGYALWLYRRMIFGALEKANLKDILDLSPREITILAPLVILTIFLGVYPSLFLDVTALSVKKLVQNYEMAVKTAELAGR